ncbi:uncharacterized protein LOC127712649 [Mytilus californianus]|uniref:uncharacterized protein LOC127712649 n=1 Tax=Mytilus californianus TaxID=6549 RepID=UPI002245C613|nr:uncharacterized protein LOC127712649 [Mytilus californianus]
MNRKDFVFAIFMTFMILFCLVEYKSVENDSLHIQAVQTIVSRNCLYPRPSENHRKKNETETGPLVFLTGNDKNLTQPQKDLEKILTIAKAMSKETVLVTVINDGFLPLAYNWLCNTKHMGVHHQVLVIATNQAAKEKLLSVSPDIKVVVLTVDKYLQKDQQYSHVGYIRLLVRRTEILLALLESRIETFLFEFDFLWLRSPLSLFKSYSGKYDMLFVHNSNRHSMVTNSVNGGFFYMFPTNTTVKLFQELYRRMQKLADRIKTWPPEKKVSEKANDQVYLNRLFSKRYGGLKALILPHTDFPDGKWYSLLESKRKSWKPYVIHNNWIIGNDNKIARAKEWGHWFLNDSSEIQCNSEVFINDHSVLKKDIFR